MDFLSKFAITFLLMVFTQISYAQEKPVEPSTDAAELAKKLANPIASLVSIPFQNNTDYGIGINKGSRNTMNIQPVVPIRLGKNINLITRMIIPVVTQFNVTGIGESQNGIGDFVLSGFLSPSNSANGFTWGAGPVLLLPVGSNDYTAKQFGAGPTAVALKQFNGWTIGGLINQIWGMAGSTAGTKVNQMFFQPFFIYNWKSGAGLGGNFEWTQNWNAGTSVVWFNPTVAGLTSLGKLKTQFVIGPRFNLAAPDGAKADLGWRAAVIFLFPK